MLNIAHKFFNTAFSRPKNAKIGLVILICLHVHIFKMELALSLSPIPTPTYLFPSLPSTSPSHPYNLYPSLPFTTNEHLLLLYVFCANELRTHGPIFTYRVWGRGNVFVLSVCVSVCVSVCSGYNFSTS